MADDELDLDVEKKSGKGKLIAIIVGAILLVAIAVGATLFFVGGSSGDGEDSEAEAAEEKKTEIVEKKAYYLKLSPHFVVNFEDSSIVNYMQVEMQVMSRDQSVLDVISEHMPVIRNNILLLLSTQKYEEISTSAGKEKLRAEILKSIQDVIEQETKASKSKDKKEDKDGDKKKAQTKVEAVYFTSFIMQ